MTTETTQLTTEEKVSKGNVEQVAIIANGMAGRDFDKLKITIMVKLYGEKIAYQADYSVSRELLNPESSCLDQFMDEIKKRFKKVLEGEVELNAIVKGA